MSFTVTGLHAIAESIERGKANECLYVARRDGRVGELAASARSRRIEVRDASEAELERLCGHRDHRGAVLVTSASPEHGVRNLKEFLQGLSSEQALVLLLDGVTDPHNLGAVIRSADQFAVDLLIVPHRRAAHETETVARVSAGAHVYVPLLVAGNLADAVTQLKEAGFWVYGAAAGGKEASSVDLRGRTALVLGSEGKGIGRLLRERCDEIVGITTRGHLDSFNVSVAAGILLYEARRQQWRSATS